MTELKPDRAEEEAREIVEQVFSTAIIDDPTPVWVEAIATALRSRDTQLAEARERIRALEGALRSLRGLVNEGGVPRYTVTPGAALNSVIEEVVDPALSARTILSPATEPPEVDQPNECRQRCFHCGDYADECQCDGGLL